MSFNPNAGQDWTPVVVQKSAKQKSAGLSTAQQVSQARMAGTVTTEKKFAAGENKTTIAGGGGSMRRLEESTEDFKHATVDKTLSKAIATARMAKKMTQKDLARAINEAAGVIQEYESGKAIPNAQVLNKLDRALGIHLPRGKK